MNNVVLIGKIGSLPYFDAAAPDSGHPLRVTIYVDDDDNGQQVIDVYLWSGMEQPIKEHFGIDGFCGLKGRLLSGKNGLYVLADRFSFIEQAAEGRDVS